MSRDERTTREKREGMTACHLQSRGEKIGDRNLSVRSILHTTYSGDENFFPPHVEARRKASPRVWGLSCENYHPLLYTHLAEESRDTTMA